MKLWGVRTPDLNQNSLQQPQKRSHRSIWSPAICVCKVDEEVEYSRPHQDGTPGNRGDIFNNLQDMGFTKPIRPERHYLSTRAEEVLYCLRLGSGSGRIGRLPEEAWKKNRSTSVRQSTVSKGSTAAHRLGFTRTHSGQKPTSSSVRSVRLYQEGQYQEHIGDP